MTIAYSSHIYRTLLRLLVLAIVSASVSCTDEIDYSQGVIPEGHSTILASFSFSPLVTADLDGRQSRSDGLELGNGNTVAPKGDAMDQIDNLYILAYDTEGRLQYTIPVDLSVHRPDWEDRTDADATGDHSAQSQTMCVKDVPITLDNGVYRIFAVANIANLLTDHSADIATVAGLRDIRLEWISNSIAQNREMLGYMTNGRTDTRDLDFETEPTVTISPAKVAEGLHAWIRRAVSKLTIDFDGSQLRDNIFVYIKEARVYDIADGAYLGHYSCIGEPGERNDAIPVKGGFGKAKSSHVLMYGAGNDYTAWPSVTNAQPLVSYRDGNDSIGLHDERAYCLPFYENMQGTGALKYQDADGNGQVDYPLAGEYDINVEGNREWRHDKAKDSKPNGTYVEVTGYYESRSNDNVTGGPIKYRFMLGKNVRDNFDCERNHHYKLTLAFKGNGNDADWHIEYSEASGIHLPNPIYVSYLYNKSLTFPVRVNTGGKTVSDIKIDITKSNWAPYFDKKWDPADLDYYREADSLGNFGRKYPELGFLSLIRTHDTRVSASDIKEYYERPIDDEGFTGKDAINRGHRRYLTEPGVHGFENNGQYVTRREGNVIELEIPLYTRAKQLIKTSAYTGNNPFTGYAREAELTVTVTYSDGSKDVKTTPVYQVRRLVNPKAVYRRRTNNSQFHVTLMELRSETAHSFHALQSIGPWRAEVIHGNGFITLDGKQSVSGGTLSQVDFNIQFTGTTPEGENRFGIVEIRYHNQTCIHQIYVMQGDEPVRMYDGVPTFDSGKRVMSFDKTKNVYWHLYNMRAKGIEANCIADEGSLFRYGKWDYPIDACNQKYTHKEYWVGITPDDFKGPFGPFLMADNLSASAKSWKDISSNASSAKFNDVTVDGSTYSLPTVAEFTVLRDATEQAYGVIYGDQATGVKEDLNEVYGFQRTAAGTINNEGFGMRGCVAYVGDTSSPYYGNFVFFPVGASGYGHRKHGGRRSGANWGDAETEDGVLRYAGGRTQPYKPANQLALPLFYDLYKRPGALYWAQREENGNPIDSDAAPGLGLGLDINYFTFDFNYIDASSTFGKGATTDYSDRRAGTSDALFIRCVDRR